MANSTETARSARNADTRLADFLESSLTSVPFYRGWSDIGASAPPAERFAALPVLRKQDLRAHLPWGFMQEHLAESGGLAAGDVGMATTSGTAEERVSVVWNQEWWDRSEREAARIHPVLGGILGRPHTEAVLTSPVCAGNICHTGDAPMRDRIVDSILFLNQTPDPTSWSEATVRRMAEELRLFGPEVLEADPAYLALLARACREAAIPLHAPACIVLTYEFPSRVHERQIRRAFPGVPIVSSYGSTETGHVFTQCGAGTFHENTATCHVDLQPFRQGAGDPAVGRILVSTVGNPWFTLLRFDVGDLGRIRTGPSCPCGRTEGLALEAIEGRVRDVTFDTRGKVVTPRRLDDSVAEAAELVGYRLDQTGPREYRARFQAEAGREPSTAQTLRECLVRVYGADAVIDARHDSGLAPEQSGKFRLARATWAPGYEDLFG